MYRQYFIGVWLFTLILIFSSPALADVYAGVSLGDASVNTSSGTTVSDTATRFFARVEWLSSGRFSPFYQGVEISVIDFGNFNGTKLRGQTIKWIYTQPYGRTFDIFGGIGALLWQVDYPAPLQDDDGSNLSGGIGFRFHIMKHLCLSLEGETNNNVGRLISGDKNDSLNVWWGSISYQF